MKIQDDSWKVGKGYNLITEHGSSCIDGQVVTPHGFVLVYAEGHADVPDITRLDFIHNGQCYCRTFIGKRYTPSGVRTKAIQFAQEIVNRG